MTASRQELARPDIERCVVEAYAEAGGALSNQQLYERTADKLGVQLELFVEAEPVGEKGTKASKPTRHARWAQQTLKVNGLLERVERGVWQLTTEGKAKLRRPVKGMALLAFSTRLGIGVWGDCTDVVGGLETDITLVLTSPPYPLAKTRAYGNVREGEYVDWLCATLEGVIAKLAPGGSLMLVLGNDIFQPGSPARSLYKERLTLALNDRFSLSKMDSLIWFNNSKPPGPVQWASLNRSQLNTAYESVLWFTNDPSQVRSDNRRVLQPHRERQTRLMAAGGEQRNERHSDGAYSLRPGRSYARQTAGRIPKNVLPFGHQCADQKAYKIAAKALGLPVHGAPMPVSLCRFLIEFMTERGDLVMDPMAGSMSVAKAAELAGRRWLACEQYGEYVLGGSTRFEGQPGFWRNDALTGLAA